MSGDPGIDLLNYREKKEERKRENREKKIVFPDETFDEESIKNFIKLSKEVSQ